MLYGAPVFILYVYAKGSFVREVVLQSRFTLSFIGFAIVSIIFTLALVVKIVVVLIKTKPSIGKYIFFILLWSIIIGVMIVGLYKFRDLMYLAEENSASFFDTVRSIVMKIKNSLIVLLGCIITGNIFKIIALSIDKDYVTKLGWL